MAVIKANAYGHGIEEYVNHCDALVDYYGVATLEEAKCIRDANSKKDILNFREYSSLTTPRSYQKSLYYKSSF